MSDQMPKYPKYRFPGEIRRDQLRTEQPLDPMLYPEMQVPTPLDPMGNIAMEGRAMRYLAKGRMPGWVLMTGWAMVGLDSFVLASVGVAAWKAQPTEVGRLVLSFAPMVLLGGVMVVILVRATWGKR